MSSIDSRAVASAVALILSTAAHASEAPSDVPADTLDEIVVTSDYTTGDRLDTATGLGLTIVETPQSVTVMTFERLLDQNLRTLSDVVGSAPGVSSRDLDSSRHTFSARGFTIDNYQIDGVPMEWTSGGDAGETESDTALYERIEIVRGSTGLLTGAGNPSASINLVRKHATATEFSGFASLGIGSWDEKTAMLDVGTGLALDGRVRGRLVLSYEDGNSFTDLMGNTKRVGYGVIEADVTDATLVRVGYSYQDNDPTASTWGGLPTWFSDGTRTDWPRSKTVGANWTEWASTNRNYFATVRHQLNERWDLRVDYNNARNDAELDLLYIIGSPNRTTGLGLFPFTRRSDTSRKQYNLGVRLSGSFDLFGRSHELIAGYSHQDQEYLSDAASAVPSTVAPIGNFYNWDGSYPRPTYGAAAVDVDQDTKQTGFYLASRLSLTDDLKLVAGGRVADWKQRGTAYGSATDFGDSGVFVPYAGLLYDLTDRHRVYGSYTEIFRPQNATDRNGRQLDPVTGKSYELGLKSALIGGAVTTTVAIFKIEQDNLAQPDTGFLVPGTIFEASRAADGATSEGFELEAVGRPLPGWELSASFTSFSAKDAQDVAVNTAQPRRLFKVFSTYQFVESLPGLTLGGGVNWEGDNYTIAQNPLLQAERLTQPSYALVNLMGRYDFTDNLRAQFNVDNLLDKKYYGQIGFFSQLAYGAPRNFNATLTYRF